MDDERDDAEGLEEVGIMFAFDDDDSLFVDRNPFFI